ncbi:hypothetical protein FEM08_21790 [Flavobacterium gilvum]|nr:hypothetical protein FEM08_21790 [Flavobacterium gilvum]
MLFLMRWENLLKLMMPNNAFWINFCNKQNSIFKIRLFNQLSKFYSLEN